MVIWHYILFFQLSETLSILFPAAIFLIVYKLSHHSSEKIMIFLKTHTTTKVILILLFCECIAFFPLLPFMINGFSPYVSNPDLLSYSILALQLVPWILKCKKIHDVIQGKKRDYEQKDHAIYQ